MDRDDALSTDTPSPDTTDPLLGRGPGRGPGSGSTRKGTGPTGDPSPDPAIDPWAPLTALVAAFEASARLQPVLDKALLWAGRGWLDLLGQGGGGYSLDHLKAAGVQLAWMKGDKKVPKLVDQVALLRGRPAMPKREGRISTLEPIGRKPKGWKPLGLELRRGLPTTADASPAASAAKALAGHLAARREDPSAFQPIDRQNPATEQALDVLRQWLTILATPSGARGEIDVPRFGWNEPVLALLDALGIRGQAVRDSGGRMSYIHVLLRDAVAFERYHDTMGLPVPELPADPTADATLTALDDWFNAPDAGRTADGANADSEPVDTAGTLVGGGGAEGGGVDGAGRGLEGAAGDDTLASSPAGDTGPVSGTVIGPITGAVTGGGRAVGPEAENDPGLVALLQLFLGEVDLAWPEGMPRSGADRKERRGQMARGPEPYPFTPAIDGIATDALFTAIALWTITQPETAWSTLSRQHRRQTLRALKKSPNNVSHLATIRQNGAPWTALATQAGYAGLPLKPIGTPPETPMAILLPSTLAVIMTENEGPAPSPGPAIGLADLEESARQAFEDATERLVERTNAWLFPHRELGPERETAAKRLANKLLSTRIWGMWVDANRDVRRGVITGPDGTWPASLARLLKAERDAALLATGVLRPGQHDTVEPAKDGTSLWANGEDIVQLGWLPPPETLEAPDRPATPPALVDTRTDKLATLRLFQKYNPKRDLNFAEIGHFFVGLTPPGGDVETDEKHYGKYPVKVMTRAAIDLAYKRSPDFLGQKFELIGDARNAFLAGFYNWTLAPLGIYSDQVIADDGADAAYMDDVVNKIQRWRITADAYNNAVSYITANINTPERYLLLTDNCDNFSTNVMNAAGIEGRAADFYPAQLENWNLASIYSAALDVFADARDSITDTETNGSKR